VLEAVLVEDRPVQTREAPTRVGRTVRRPSRSEVEEKDEPRTPRRSRPAPAPRRRLWPWALCLVAAGVVGLCILPRSTLDNLPGLSALSRLTQPSPLNPEEFPAALADLKSVDSSRRRTAAQRLTRTEPNDQRAEVATSLEAALRDPDPRTRTAVAQALGVWGTVENVPALARLIGDFDGHVRAATMSSLSRFPDERAATAIASRLSDSWDSAAASQALQGMGAPAEKAVRGYLANGDHRTKLAACQILRVVATKESVPALQAAARDPDLYVAQAAKDALVALGETPDPAPRTVPGTAASALPKGVLDLETALADLRSANLLTRREAARRLAQLDPNRERPEFLTVLVAPAPAGSLAVVPWGALVLSAQPRALDLPSRRHQEVAQALEGLLNSSSSFDREEAARALGVWGTRESVPPLLRVSQSPHSGPKKAAQDALARLGAAP
jgi:HEAT repeat protein